jgi:hypothetical protein
MITATMTGNFGNHMWNYVLCRLVAEKLGYEWGVSPIATHDYHNGDSQLYFLDINYGKEVTKIGTNSRTLNVYDGIPNEYYDDKKTYIHNGEEHCINMYDPNVFNIKDNTMIHLTSQSEEYLIDRKLDIYNWLKIKDEYKIKYEQQLSEKGLILDDNTCVINFRGGEYRGITNLICRREYWNDSINHMLSANPDMKFVIITDDVDCAKHFVGDYPCYHDEIGFDFYVINKAKYNILSNSSFGWWAAWLNDNSKLIIAPKYWSKHNISNGFWGLGDQYVRSFMYMSREGVLQNYEECKEEALEFYKNNNLL